MFFDLVLHPVALALNGDGFGVMQEPIQHGGGQSGIVVKILAQCL